MGDGRSTNAARRAAWRGHRSLAGGLRPGRGHNAPSKCSGEPGRSPALQAPPGSTYPRGDSHSRVGRSPCDGRVVRGTGWTSRPRRTWDARVPHSRHDMLAAVPSGRVHTEHGHCLADAAREHRLHLAQVASTPNEINASPIVRPAAPAGVAGDGCCVTSPSSLMPLGGAIAKISGAGCCGIEGLLDAHDGRSGGSRRGESRNTRYQYLFQGTAHSAGITCVRVIQVVQHSELGETGV